MEPALISIAVLLSAVSTWTDIRDRVILDETTLMGAIVVASIYLGSAIYGSIQWINVLYGLIAGVLAFIYGFVMYKIKVWYGGDVKLLAVLVFALYPYGLDILWIFWTSTLILSGAWGLAYWSFRHFYDGTNVLSKKNIKEFESGKLKAYGFPMAPGILAAVLYTAYVIGSTAF